jgi:hypothetical protein
MPVERTVYLFKKGEKIFTTKTTVGSSGHKETAHFKYLGEVLDHVRKTYMPSYWRSRVQEQLHQVGLALSKLKAGEYSRVIFNERDGLVVEE